MTKHCPVPFLWFAFGSHRSHSFTGLVIAFRDFVTIFRKFVTSSEIETLVQKLFGHYGRRGFGMILHSVGKMLLINSKSFQIGGISPKLNPRNYESVTLGPQTP